MAITSVLGAMSRPIEVQVQPSPIPISCRHARRSHPWCSTRKVVMVRSIRLPIRAHACVHFSFMHHVVSISCDVFEKPSRTSGARHVNHCRRGFRVCNTQEPSTQHVNIRYHTKARYVSLDQRLPSLSVLPVSSPKKRAF